MSEDNNELLTRLIASQKALAAQTAELDSVTETVQRDRDQFESFCRMLSHDIAAPLRRVNQLIQFLKEDLTASQQVSQNEINLLDGIVSECGEMDQLIHGLLSYSRADSGQVPTHDVDLTLTLMNVMEELTAIFGSRPEVTCEELPTVYGNDAQLHLILKNIIENAIVHNNNTPKVSVTCDHFPETGHIEITVKDNGRGMREEDTQVIFNAFTRLHNDNATRGAGLGLSTVKKLLKCNSGNIRVESKENEGSRFILTLPVTREVAA